MKLQFFHNLWSGIARVGDWTTKLECTTIDTESQTCWETNFRWIQMGTSIIMFLFWTYRWRLWSERISFLSHFSRFNIFDFVVLFLEKRSNWNWSGSSPQLFVVILLASLKLNSHHYFWLIWSVFNCKTYLGSITAKNGHVNCCWFAAADNELSAWNWK